MDQLVVGVVWLHKSRRISHNRRKTISSGPKEAVENIKHIGLYIKKTAGSKMVSGENVKGKTSKMAIFSKNVFLRVE